jgi:hypothetical protein
MECGWSPAPSEFTVRSDLGGTAVDAGCRTYYLDRALTGVTCLKKGQPGRSTTRSLSSTRSTRTPAHNIVGLGYKRPVAFCCAFFSRRGRRCLFFGGSLPIFIALLGAASWAGAEPSGMASTATGIAASAALALPLFSVGFLSVVGFSAMFFSGFGVPAIGLPGALERWLRPTRESHLYRSTLLEFRNSSNPEAMLAVGVELWARVELTYVVGAVKNARSAWFAIVLPRSTLSTHNTALSNC